MRAMLISAVVLCAALTGCGSDGTPEPAEATEDADDVATRAEELAKRLLTVDTHIDVPYRLNERPADVSARTEDGDFDYPRAVEGGLDVAFMSVYVPAALQGNGAKAFADEMIEMVEGIVADHPEKFVLVTSPDEAAAVLGSGRVGLAMGMENGAPIEGDLANLRRYFDRGIRYITLTHSENNHICDSSYADERRWDGLSPFGRELVTAMNDVGMMIDVSHVSDATFDQVLERSRAPVIASHSSLRHYTPGWERNMSDDMVRALGAAGGVVQINFGSGFLSAESNRQGREYWEARGRHMAEQGLEPASDEMKAWDEAYWAEREKLFADVTDVADHIDRVVELAGIDHVGLGSDYDGVGDTLPTGLKDVSQYPNLVAELLRRGYDRDGIEKILGGNLLRVWREVERVAAGD